MATVCLVTGYVPIPGHPRSAEEYGKLGEGFRTVVAAPVIPFYQSLHDCWLVRFQHENPDLTHSVGDNPEKNTVAYHAVNHQKTEWLRQAAILYPFADVYVWVDYGLFHLPGVTGPVIDDFVRRLDEKCIYIPGCWEGPVIQNYRMDDRIPHPDSDKLIDDNNPCWRFCGSVLACPKKYVADLADAVRDNAIRYFTRTQNISWEVNTWARVEKERKLPIKWYKADHNETLFTGFKGCLDA